MLYENCFIKFISCKLVSQYETFHIKKTAFFKAA